MQYFHVWGNDYLKSETPLLSPVHSRTATWQGGEGGGKYKRTQYPLTLLSKNRHYNVEGE